MKQVLGIVLSLFIALGGVVAEAAGDPQLEKLVAAMTLEEKIGQLNLRGRGSRSSYNEIPDALTEAVRAGRVGALINIMTVADVDRLQRIAVEESPHGIPLLFGRDVIHGLHAVAPIPLGQAATWNLDSVREGARVAARDATAYGIRWTFAPMLDLTRDPRWGRIAESPGEDPYLASRLAVAMVEGLQGDNLSDPTRVAACLKHFAAYGAGEGGRDYATATVAESELRNIYLPPFKAAIEAGAASVMSGFNELNGIPASAHPLLLTQILRREWAFDGFVVSDWNSVVEMIPHGYAEDPRAAARLAVNAGLDLEMMSTAFEDHLADLVATGEVTEATIDTAVHNLLRIKHRLGLFDQPYRRASGDPTVFDEPALQVAERLARDSVVLLRNEGRVLPLSNELERIAVIGPLADAPHEQLGTWAFDGRREDTRTPLHTLRARLGEDRVLFSAGLSHSRSRSREGFTAALTAAKAADVVLFFGGEEAILSGEAHSRADLRLPGAQEDLLRELAATGKPLVLILMAGRPLVLHDVLEDLDGLLMAWHPGTMGGPALADLLLGVASPSGRLPTTWPKGVGQVPIYYNHKNTGRPADPSRWIPIEDIPVGAWQSSLSNTSHYLDLGLLPEFPFGFGLTYSSLAYSDQQVAPRAIHLTETLEISATVTNTGPRAVTEVAQLYVRDLVGSRTRPVRELKGFERISLEPGEARRVRFQLAAEDLAFFDGEEWKSEPGRFEVGIVPDASASLPLGFEVLAVGGPSGPHTASRQADVGSVERLDAALDTVVAPGAEMEVLAEGFKWSEGPLWIAEGGYLLFSDVPRNSIFRWSDAKGLDRWLRGSGYTGTIPRGGEPGSNGLLLDSQGRLVLCQHGDRRIARLEGGLEEPRARIGTVPRFETLAGDHDGQRFNSPNDAVMSRGGDIFFTDPPYGLEKGPQDPAREIAVNGVYRVSPEGAVTLLTDELTRPNGIALSPDESTLYVANSDPQRAIWMAYELEPGGSLGQGRIFFDATQWVDTRPGLPDGLKVDREGNLFATGPGGVLVLAPDGRHLGTLRTPGPTANCAFGDDGSSLYLTSGDRLLRVRLNTTGFGFDSADE